MTCTTNTTIVDVLWCVAAVATDKQPGSTHSLSAADSAYAPHTYVCDAVCAAWSIMPVYTRHSFPKVNPMGSSIWGNSSLSLSLLRYLPLPYHPSWHCILTLTTRLRCREQGRNFSLKSGGTKIYAPSLPFPSPPSFPEGLGTEPPVDWGPGVLPPENFGNLICDLVHSSAFWREIGGFQFPLPWTPCHCWDPRRTLKCSSVQYSQGIYWQAAFHGNC